MQPHVIAAKAWLMVSVLWGGGGRGEKGKGW